VRDWWDEISWRRAAASCNTPVLLDLIGALTDVPIIHITVGVRNAEAAIDPNSQRLRSFLLPNNVDYEWNFPHIYLAITYN
jgi:hypothetical protein